MGLRRARRLGPHQRTTLTAGIPRAQGSRYSRYSRNSRFRHCASHARAQGELTISIAEERDETAETEGAAPTAAAAAHGATQSARAASKPKTSGVREHLLRSLLEKRVDAGGAVEEEMTNLLPRFRLHCCPISPAGDEASGEAGREAGHHELVGGAAHEPRGHVHDASAGSDGADASAGRRDGDEEEERTTLVT